MDKRLGVRREAMEAERGYAVRDWPDVGMKCSSAGCACPCCCPAFLADPIPLSLILTADSPALASIPFDLPPAPPQHHVVRFPSIYPTPNTSSVALLHSFSKSVDDLSSWSPTTLHDNTYRPGAREKVFLATKFANIFNFETMERTVDSSGE